MKQGYKAKDLAQWCGGTLVKGNPEAPVIDISTDTRELNSGDTFLALEGERFNGHDFVRKAFETGTHILVLKKDHPVVAMAMQQDITLIAVDDTLHAYGEIARNYRKQFDKRIIALTGSVGKTSTRGLVASVLSQRFNVLESDKNFNNLIGLPKTILRLDDAINVSDEGNMPGDPVTFLSILTGLDADIIEGQASPLGDGRGLRHRVSPRERPPRPRE